VTVRLLCGDALEQLRLLAENGVDAVVTDPPYHLTTWKPGGRGTASENLNSPAGRSRATTGFMGKTWDGGDIAHDPIIWREALRIAKPGAHLLAFGGTRTFHRLTCAIEDAGWEIRDCLMWVYGSGFPKSLDVSKAIDKAAGVERQVSGKRIRFGDRRNYPEARNGAEIYGKYPEHGDVTIPATDGASRWAGWGTGLKPAWEPIILARKPLEGTVAENVQKWGTGALNIDRCRVEIAKGDKSGYWPADVEGASQGVPGYGGGFTKGVHRNFAGRWPANLIHDGSEEVVGMLPAEASGPRKPARRTGGRLFGRREGTRYAFPGSGSAARFFYCAKASKEDRGEGNNHPTVKPTDLMQYLCRLITPPGGTVLDPFMGSGSTGKAAVLEGFGFIGIDNVPEYVEIARRRIEGTAPLFAEVK